MTRYVIGPDVAVRLARDRVTFGGVHDLLAPTLIRSQILSLLYQSVQRGELSDRDADALLSQVRALRIRLLGDRVLQSTAWKVADDLGWPDTFDAEYIALTRLQADALVTFDDRLARGAERFVRVAPISELTGVP